MTQEQPSPEPAQPKRVEVLPVKADHAASGYRDTAPMGPEPLLLRRRAEPPKGFVAFVGALLASQVLGLWLAESASTRITLAVMVVLSTALLAYALYYGVLNATLIRIDADSLSREDRAKGMHAFEAPTRSIVQVFAARADDSDRVHRVNVRSEDGDIERLLACDDAAEAEYIAFQLDRWLVAHRGERD